MNKKTMNIYELISHAASRVGVTADELLTSRSQDLYKFRASIVHHLRSQGWRECSVVRALGISQSMANYIMTRCALGHGYQATLRRHADILGLAGINVPPPAPKTKAESIRPVHGQLVLDLVSEHLDVPIARILDSEDLTHDASRARAIACWLLRSFFGYNQTSIGRFIGRHRTAVHAAIKRAEDLRHNKLYSYVMDSIIKELKNKQMLK